MNDCKDYFLETGRRVSFEYTLLGTVITIMKLAGVVLSKLCAEFFKKFFCQLELMIPWSMQENLQSSYTNGALATM